MSHILSSTRGENVCGARSVLFPTPVGHTEVATDCGRNLQETEFLDVCNATGLPVLSLMLHNLKKKCGVKKLRRTQSGHATKVRTTNLATAATVAAATAAGAVVVAADRAECARGNSARMLR